ncbi:hypothetical protein Q5425_22130 [Amycolatopsis sp. A133]|uniref:hypothetical protein n=1 Tax=Amycolatopsis sp. A133 TaxID=3064472 RepID=UPI0027FDDD84|nr:hypothetical protein [Amycolatopsis sp. A133]MDQ7806448.1 hypothetical protein [Amycolatopsis sp. A133]
MPKTGFNHNIDGFAFGNGWPDLSPDDLHQLSDEIGNVVLAASFSPPLLPFAALIPPGPPVSNFLLKDILQQLVTQVKEPIFGLCGGMACAALDYYRLAWVPPRGTGRDDYPSFGTSSGATLRRYIWSRLIDTLHTDGITCLLWMATQFEVFPFSGGTRELLRRTRDEEWPKIKRHLDDGTPWPIGLVGETRDPMHNHQVLATGYDDPGNGRPTLYMYDSNCPDRETALQIDFTGAELKALHTGYPDGVPGVQGSIRGFFCESYTPRTPPAALVVESGLNVSPAGTVPVSRSVRLRYQVRNVGFGPSPALRLYGVGRVVANGRNVDAGADRPAAEPLPEGAARAYDKTVALSGDLGLRRFSVGASVEHNGTQAWRALPAPAPLATVAFDVVVGAEPTSWATLGGQLVAPPVAGTNADGRLIVVGVGLDNRLYRIEQNAPGSRWDGWTLAAPGCPPLTGRAAVARTSDGRLELFARGADGQIWHAWQNQAGTTDWSSWSGLGDSFAADPAAIANQDGRLEVFAVAPEGRLRHKWQYPFGWNGWADLGGPVTGRPGAGRHPDGRLEVFARHPDGTIFHTWQRGPGGDWEHGEFGGQVTGDIAVANNADGRIEVFARGTDGAIWHRRITGGGWSAWESLGGRVEVGVVPAVARNASGGLEVFVLGTDHAVWHNRQVPATQRWSGWTSLGGGPVAADPVAVVNADGRLELFALGVDHTLVHRWETGSGWNS